MFKEKEYSNIRFGLVKLIANDTFSEVIWDSLTDEEVIKTIQNQLSLLNFKTSVSIDDRTNGLNVSIQVDLGDETGIITCNVVPSGQLQNQ